MASQIAKLFARGSLLNVTAKYLTPDKVKEVESLIRVAWDDPELKRHQYEFCAALGRTVGGEYKEPGGYKYAADKKHLTAAMCDLNFIFWRVAVDVLYHHPKPSVVTDRVARQKYFKTHIWNYLRQIQNENKPAVHKEKVSCTRPANILVMEQIKLFMDNGGHKAFPYSLDDSDLKNIIFTADFWKMPIKQITRIWAFRKQAAAWGVTIDVGDYDLKITVDELPVSVKYSMTTADRIRFADLISSSDEDGQGIEPYTEQHKEIRRRMDPVMLQDLTDTLVDRLDEDCKAVFQLTYNPPREFIDKYCPSHKIGFTPRDSQIAEWLGITKDEVVEIREKIQNQARALDIHPD